MSWLAIWDSMGPVLAPQSAAGRPLPLGSFVLEARLVTHRCDPALMWAGRNGARRHFALHWDIDGALALCHGPIACRTQADFIMPGEVVDLFYSWDRFSGTGEIRIQNAERDQAFALRVPADHDVSFEDFLPDTPSDKAALGSAAIASHRAETGAVSGFAAGTPIDTPDGPVPVESLAPGMIVDTISHGPQPVRWTGRREVLARGSMAPVLLRAPYFGLTRDALVSRGTRMMLSGPEVEYLFGQDQVLARAGDLLNGVSTVLDLNSPTRTYHHFLLDDHDCVRVGRCPLESLLLAELVASQGKPTESLAPADCAPAFPTIGRAETQALLALIAEHRRVAA